MECDIPCLAQTIFRLQDTAAHLFRQASFYKNRVFLSFCDNIKHPLTRKSPPFFQEAEILPWRVALRVAQTLRTFYPTRFEPMLSIALQALCDGDERKNPLG
jgi:hypothetical protein